MTDKQAAEGQHSEEDLLADFRDVLGEDDDTRNPPPEETSTDLDALDAFLNEFGNGAAAMKDEAEAGQEAEVGRDPLLDEVAELAAADEPKFASDLNLDVGGDESAVPELSVGVGVAPEDLDLAEVEEMVEPPPQARGHSDDLFATVAPPPSAAAPAPVPIMAAEDEPVADNKTLDISTIGVALLSLVVAAVAGWFALSLHGQMNQLRAELEQLRQQPGGVIVGPDRQAQEAVASLTQRVNEMAMLIDGPMGHLSASTEQLNTVSARLDTLEQRISGLREELKNASPPAMAAKVPDKVVTAKPVAAPAKPAAVSPPLAVATSKATGGWVVNVASLTDAKAASAEQQRLKQAGFNVEVQTAQMDGRTWYRVRATGFASREAAQVYSDMVRHKMGVTPWVGLDK